jgi:GTPase Era involved in 16S rRNA processing
VLTEPAPHTRSDGKLHISISIPVESVVKRAIVVGRGGALINTHVRAAAEADLALLLQRPVALHISVPVAGDSKRLLSRPVVLGRQGEDG